MEEKFERIDKAHSLWEDGLDSDSTMDLIDSAIKGLFDFFDREYADCVSKLKQI